MKFLQLDTSDKSKELLQDFLDNAGESLDSFRYYKSRDFNVIKNHIFSFLLYSEGECVGYGHLDREKQNVWLGICVRETYIGLGYGDIIMKKLVSLRSGSILLTVDTPNKVAINLYKKYNFVITSETRNICLMERK
tara:strand:+ start:2808 stop:3215 length:408 start_codon:yes stop_codon:yes gene_type:complete